MSAREELAALLGKHYGTSAAGDDYLWGMADIIMEKGWVKAEPVWLDTLPNDGTYEYTISSDCDGSNANRYRRLPGKTYDEKPGKWELYEPEADQ